MLAQPVGVELELLTPAAVPMIMTLSWLAVSRRRSRVWRARRSGDRGYVLALARNSRRVRRQGVTLHATGQVS